MACAQGGEFAFVLLSLALTDGVLGQLETQTLSLVVGVSMATTPLGFAALEWVLKKVAPPKAAKPFDAITHDDPQVLIAGFGRVGQVVGRLLTAKRMPFTALDASSEHVDFVRKFGNQVFYGDASRLELLEAAGAAKARIFVLAIDDVEASMKTVELVKRHFPHLLILARARNRQHTYRLLEAGVQHIFRETLGSSLELSGQVLRELGLTPSDVDRALRRFREHDEALLLRTFREREDMEKLQRIARSAAEELQRLFEEDAKTEAGQGERAA
jgi:voltage-gated potassium channel Kch